MGIRDELQTEVAAAFDTDLQDAVKDFTGSYTVRGAWDPVTETGTETKVTLLGAWSAGALLNCAVSMALTFCMVM
ncbi:Uncharacterised protein [Klebsiella pneumoniae]|uniref:Uncharacterized protein n=1 Tax=Klebsiella pneumoniae TaxID=573 RepID=A0A377TT07_KLEPN|nr:Uncharacterised protein [Klebsiella pneumoniae]